MPRAYQCKAPGIRLRSEKAQHDIRLPFWFGDVHPEWASHIPPLANGLYHTPSWWKNICSSLYVSALKFLDSGFINSHILCCKEYEKKILKKIKGLEQCLAHSAKLISAIIDIFIIGTSLFYILSPQLTSLLLLNNTYTSTATCQSWLPGKTALIIMMSLYLQPF